MQMSSLDTAEGSHLEFTFNLQTDVACAGGGEEFPECKMHLGVQVRRASRGVFQSKA